MNSIIIDDEQLCIDAMIWELKTHCPLIKVLACANDGIQGLELINTLKPDLIFLDIEMPKLNGFQMLEALTPYQGMNIVFTTAYDKFALDAFRINASNYLLKPIDGQELKKAIQFIESRQQTFNIKQFFEFSNQIRENKIEKIAIHCIDGIEVLYLKDIICLNADRNYTEFCLTDTRKIIASKSMKEYEDNLCQNGFMRVHKSHIINLNHIRKFVKGENNLILSNQLKASVSVNKKDQLLAFLDNQMY